MRMAAITLGAFVAWGPVSTVAQHEHSHKVTEYNGQPGTIIGHVRDAACLFRNPAAGAPSDAAALECAEKCVLAGSPLVVFTGDGQLYFVISAAIPDASQGKRYMPYVGKLVKASGRVFERAGTHAIAIESIETVPSK
jgi:hypothetical protein